MGIVYTAFSEDRYVICTYTEIQSRGSHKAATNPIVVAAAATSAPNNHPPGALNGAAEDFFPPPEEEERADGTLALTKSGPHISLMSVADGT